MDQRFFFGMKHTTRDDFVTTKLTDVQRTIFFGNGNKTKTKDEKIGQAVLRQKMAE